MWISSPLLHRASRFLRPQPRRSLPPFTAVTLASRYLHPSRVAHCFPPPPLSLSPPAPLVDPRDVR
uniref:Uncharacterized protein n=1 Tax=Oryza nivara TaxID=4536 RepID=A0A0E0HKU0_ORYNI